MWEDSDKRPKIQNFMQPCCSINLTQWWNILRQIPCSLPGSNLFLRLDIELRRYQGLITKLGQRV